MPGGTGGPTETALAAWAALDEEACMRVRAILAAQPSLWDAVVPKPARTPRPPLRTVPLPASGKRPDRDTRLVVAGEGEAATGQQHYAWAGEMACGRERLYAQLVRWGERDDRMAARRCVSIERVRVVVSE